MEKENKIRLLKIITSAALLFCAFMIDRALDLPLWGSLLIYLPAYLVVGGEVIIEAGESIIHGELLGEDFLMSIATTGALLIGFLPDAEPEFAEAVFVMLFFNIGELFEELAEDRSRRSVSHLMDIRPDSANVERDGLVAAVSPDSVSVGEIIVVRPGERVPLDGRIVEGASALDTSSLTGESRPLDVDEDDTVCSGCVNLSGVLRIRVTHTAGESTAEKILALVENASESKSKSESFITKFARFYTPVVVLAALTIAFLPPIIVGDFKAEFAVWLYRALTFLVVSCPCALVISVPLAFFGGIGGAARRGVLIKGGNYMETLVKTNIAVFDKTGTLTEGVFSVSAVHPQSIDERRLLHIAAHVERFSTHPVAASLRDAYGNEDDGCEVSNVREIAGEGVTATVNGECVAVGNERLMTRVGAKPTKCDAHHNGSVVHVAREGVYAGHIVISDIVKDDAADAIAELRKTGVGRVVMLTGDREETARETAAELGIDEYNANLLPDGKLKEVEKLIGENGKGKLAFVGDGINDAPTLTRADVGIAMGAMGSDAAIEAADVVIMDDKPSKIADAIRISRRTLAIAKENIVFALTIKAAVLGLAAFGAVPMGVAVFADVGVMVIAVLNAARALKG